MPGSAAEMPAIVIEPITGHPLLHSLVTVGDRFGLLVRRDDTIYAVVRIPADFPLVDEAIGITDLDELNTWWSQRYWITSSAWSGAVRVFDDAMDALTDLRDEWQGKFLYFSPREPTGRHINTYLREPGDPNEQLCRDDDCHGQHAWLTSLGEGRAFSYVWHLNLETCQIVPPSPLVIGR